MPTAFRIVWSMKKNLSGRKRENEFEISLEYRRQAFNFTQEKFSDSRVGKQSIDIQNWNVY